MQTKEDDQTAQEAHCRIPIIVFRPVMCEYLAAASCNGTMNSQEYRPESRSICRIGHVIPVVSPLNETVPGDLVSLTTKAIYLFSMVCDRCWFRTLRVTRVCQWDLVGRRWGGLYASRVVTWAFFLRRHCQDNWTPALESVSNRPNGSQSGGYAGSRLT
ncbi:uncharacterized protein BO95DRAFT_159529 [Aspergillus brunneoviolaceus CBS 621.78]|uniref:Uncharacterized protein n=1 Tax=Aspergillus brunneoviolaceus CBS 621.78 TaxID=1450534 RepID=A0ACD1GMX1_9EURO|nr:hypothetical protein BO95DRAFT_159529 [Aspergillus brunneoviolaceus CBS 621.78]RAH50685.1 hypothetical protein BO95DRAFT_159529 [Aspergillus brunneoviolaceus CBS 621.78]